ncbi:MAG TPA: FAD-binding protein [Acidimicrobiia bacterium]|nr:FAD-binding protein [Acidimicrobiia bacterium]
MRIATLVKQIPAFEEMRLGPDGRLARAGLELEMNPYCRRAVSQAVELAAAVGDGTVTVFTLGPPSAEDVLREAIAWGTENAVAVDAVLITDPAFAGSDTLATAKALAAAITREGPFDLVLLGRNSVDADTGQVGPELAELLDLPFATGVRHLSVKGSTFHLRCEHDDGWVQLEVDQPLVASCAERLIDPCKVPPEGRATVDPEMIRVVDAHDLGPGPWGADASPTRVGPVRVHEVEREQVVLTGSPEEQVRAAVRRLQERNALVDPEEDAGAILRVCDPVGDGPGAGPSVGPNVGVVLEPDRAHTARELLGAAAGLAREIGGRVSALTLEAPRAAVLGSWGADEIVAVEGDLVEEDVARVVAEWGADPAAWAILAPSTAWGREVAGRAAARLGAGLTGDAVGLEVGRDADAGRLVAWKPAFGGQLVAAILTSSPVQMATVRAGVLPSLAPRSRTASVRTVTARPRGRVTVLARTRDDDLDSLAEARAVVGVGQGVAPDDYRRLDPLLSVLGAELGATRKVTDQGWLPRARQIGITGRTIAPRIHVAIGTSGKFNHMVGVRAAGTVLAINPDPDALVFQVADIGIVGSWTDVVPLLVDEIASATSGSNAPKERAPR